MRSCASAQPTAVSSSTPAAVQSPAPTVQSTPTVQAVVSTQTIRVKPDEPKAESKEEAELGSLFERIDADGRAKLALHQITTQVKFLGLAVPADYLQGVWNTFSDEQGEMGRANFIQFMIVAREKSAELAAAAAAAEAELRLHAEAESLAMSMAAQPTAAANDSEAPAAADTSVSLPKLATDRGNEDEKPSSSSAAPPTPPQRQPTSPPASPPPQKKQVTDILSVPFGFQPVS